MTNLKELRLNNWVYSLEIGGYVQIASIDSEFVTLKDHVTWDYVYADMIEPIPLTEEILLKCGFTVYDIKYGYFSHKDVPGILQLFDGVAEYSIDSNEVCWVNGLHQLQNLYFSLTQTELEVHL